MSSLVVWNIEDNSQENQENFKQIADWWARLKGQRIKRFTFSGSQENGSFNTEDSLVIYNPVLRDNSISYKGSTPIKVKRLEFNTNDQSLKVSTPNSTTIQIFQIDGAKLKFL